MSDSNVAVSKDYVDDSITFDNFNLDPRLIQAINKLGFEHPTLIQSQSIKLSLQEKKDIIAKASTGSGKTAAYCIPIIQSILVGKESSNSKNDNNNKIETVILVPTKELAKQVSTFLKDLTIYCGKFIKIVNVNDIINDKLLTTVLNENPEIIVSTPSKLLSILELNSNISLMELKYLVIDEVDLILSYGYDEDLEKLSNYLNLKQHMQVFMMSATLNEDINKFKFKFCNKPAILKLQDLDNQNKRLLQYYIKTNEYDKFLLIYVILKLNLIKGKILIFVNNLDRGYKLKLFLQNFGIRSCILNSELPINSRLHILEEFNKNVYNLLIATDESNEYDEEEEEEEEEKIGELEGEEKIEEEENDETKKQQKQNNNNNSKNKKKFEDAKEYSVSRGVDFKNVACVINFDLPTSSKAYIHRVGRTARGGKNGMSLSFVTIKNEWGKHKQSSLPSARKDEKILNKIERTQKKLGFQLEPYQFDKKQLDNFRYRMDDSFRSITQTAIREARLKEIKMELMTSEKLKRHFEENPQDLETLRHDKALSKIRSDVNLKRIPDYLLPPGARQDAKKLGFIPFAKNKKRQQGKKRGNGGKKKVDVLKKHRK
ncbi:ATP-dependent DNA/RNA helicase [Pichia californica]|uniref:ATP-dependent RNA helicase DBP9 n=1 Tax=Pichia californica TaxID=460514 RepID=A0A9P6WLN0_9ASCO|nr:ATP-dependent DNA/RNA helicase [[Candida] californica]